MATAAGNPASLRSLPITTGRLMREVPLEGRWLLRPDAAALQLLGSAATGSVFRQNFARMNPSLKGPAAARRVSGTRPDQARANDCLWIVRHFRHDERTPRRVKRRQ